MATLNDMSSSMNAVTNLVVPVAIAAVAFVLADQWTQFARNNLVDLGVQGADAVYALAAMFLLMLLPIPRKYSRPAAIGVGVSGGVTVLEQYDVIPDVM